MRLTDWRELIGVSALCSALLLAPVSHASAAQTWAPFQAYSNNIITTVANFEAVYENGGGGYSKSIDIANDGTKVSTVDIWGAFVAQPGTSSGWTPLINSTAFSSITTCANNNLPFCWQFDGPWDARIAHSNSQIIFVNWNESLYLSTNQGAGFTNVSGATGLPVGSTVGNGDTGGNASNWCSAGGNTARLSNPKINIDPTQASLASLTVIVPTARYGTYITKNGGTSFGLIATVPTTFPGSGGTTGTTTSSTTSGAVLNFSGGPPGGLTTNYVAVDETHPFAIPPNTFYASQGATTVTLSNSVNSTVSSGDVISFYYPGVNGCPQLELVAFDPITSSTIYIADPGSGILQSTNGGATFAQITAGTPPAATDVGSSMVVCKDERVYFVDQNNGFVYVYNPSTPAWTKSSQNGIWAVACDPAVTTGTVAAVGQSGGLVVSTDHGVTWNSDESGGSATRVATDVPWLAITPEAMNSSEIQYDPSQSQILYMAEGIGVWHTPIVNGGETTHTWTSQTAGIESLQGAGLVKSPSYTYPFMLYWDRAGFGTTNPNSYTAPAVQYQLSGTAGAGNAIVGGWSGDYAAGTSTFCVLANSNFGALTPISGCTSDGVNFTQFPVEPDMLPLVTSAGSSVGSSTLTFSSVPIMIGDDLTRQMSDVGTIVFPASTVSSGSNTVSVTSLSATVKKGDLVNTVGPGYLTNGAAGFQGTVGSQALIESISGGTLTLNVNAGASIPTTTMLQIQQPLQYKTNQAAPAANDLCFSAFRGDINGITMTGLNVPHATVVANITNGGACGAGEITVQTSNNLSVTDPGNTSFSFGLPNSPLPGQFLSATGNTSTTLHLTSVVAYPNASSANTDGVRTGETIAFQSPPGSDMAVSSPTNIMYTREDNFSGAPFPLYTTDGGNTWNPAILCGSSCGTMAGFNADGSASSNNCYAGGHGGFPHIIAADRVRANTFYVFNHCGHGLGTGIGIYRTIDGGVTWTRQFADSPVGNVNLGGGAGLIGVPGEQDHVWFSNGSGFSGAHGNDTSGDLERSCDGGVTWYYVDATNLLNVASFDFGAPTPGGNGYPSVEIYGNVNGVWGKWRGDNITPTCASGQTVAWTQIGDQFLDGQLNIAGMIWLSADTTRYGYFYINAGGGSVWGHHSFLLGRDLPGHPANDNLPAFLNRAA